MRAGVGLKAPKHETSRNSDPLQDGGVSRSSLCPTQIGPRDANASDGFPEDPGPGIEIKRGTLKLPTLFGYARRFGH